VQDSDVLKVQAVPEVLRVLVLECRE